MNNIQKTESLLEQAVNDTPDVKGNYQEGLKAINSTDKTKFKFSDTRKIGGSLDIDTSTKDKYPNDNRWDYAVEYDRETFFVEIHPGREGELERMLRKLEWLKWWLNNEAPLINALKPKNKKAYYWVFTGRNTIIPTSRWARLPIQIPELAYVKYISL